jgi:hypothetical protein
MLKHNRKNTKQLKKIYTLTVLLFTVLYFYRGNAQVTIGALDDPVSGALLEIKSQDSTKGVLIPRVKLIKYDSLAPLCTGAITDVEKKKVTGMVVYNVNSSAKGINAGIVEWNGTEWVMPGEKSRVAEFSILCSGIKANGYYNENRVLQPFCNTLTLPVHVDLPGVYNISVMALEGNSQTYAGFSYKASGEFSRNGSQTITLNGEGKPLNSTQTLGGIKNSLQATLNGQIATNICANVIQVDGPEAKFSLNCASIINFVGNPKKGVNITENDNKVILINIISTEAGGEFIIESDVINGVRLKGMGVLEGNNQTVTLYATGTPTDIGEYTYTIVSNSSTTTAICSITIEYVL